MKTVNISARINEELIDVLNEITPHKGNIRERIEFILKQIKDRRIIFINDYENNIILKAYGIDGERFILEAITEKLDNMIKNYHAVGCY